MKWEMVEERGMSERRGGKGNLKGKKIKEKEKEKY